MCGIFGLVTSTGDRLEQGLVSRCLATISHRGPDANHITAFASESASGYLAHVRLSIIDLTGGAQPMPSADGRYLLSFNGEIYNYLEIKGELTGLGYRFSETSDTEVLLNAYREWGGDCVNHLRGMFAFAVWDNELEELFVARDHFGKKPVFYTAQQDVFYFSSEIKALLEVPTLKFSFNANQLRNYAVYRYVPGPETFVREVKKLPPGSTLTWSRGKYSIERYFVPAEKDQTTQNVSPQQAIDQFWDILDESVRLRMAADVPFGAFLSGGIDSSAVVALMSKHSSQRVKTFSIGFSESEYSELKYAAKIADYFDTDHHELVVSQDDLMALLPEVIRFRDAPVCEPSDIPIYLLAKEARKTVKMVLTGEGSDEVLGGYPKHSFERYAGAYQLLPDVVRSRLLGALINVLPYRFRRAKTAIRNLNTTDFNERMPGWFGALSARQADALLKSGDQAPLPALEHASGTGKLHDILLFDQLSWLPENLLERGDRMTMAASLEARMPFMDIELARFAASLPDTYRIHGRTTKWILRRAMEKVLPRKIIERPKVGFRVPVNEWFRTSMRDYLESHLLSDTSLSKAFYNEKTLEKLLREHISGSQNHEKVLWMLLNLEIWLQQNRERIAI